MMSRYSWRKKDIGKLAAKLQGYEIEERRNLNDRGKIEESLEVKSDNMNADLEYYHAYVFLGDLKNKRELSQKDSNLVEIVRKEYRFFYLVNWLWQELLLQRVPDIGDIILRGS